MKSHLVATQQPKTHPHTTQSAGLSWKSFLFEDDHEFGWTFPTFFRSGRVARTIGYAVAVAVLLLFGVLLAQLESPGRIHRSEPKSVANPASSPSEPSVLLSSQPASTVGSQDGTDAPAGERNYTFASMFASDGLMGAPNDSSLRTNGSNSAVATGATNATTAGVQGFQSGGGGGGGASGGAASGGASIGGLHAATVREIAAAVPDTGTSAELLVIALGTVGSGRLLFKRSPQAKYR